MENGSKKYQASINHPSNPLPQPGFLDATNNIMFSSKEQTLANSYTPPSVLINGITKQNIEKE